MKRREFLKLSLAAPLYFAVSKSLAIDATSNTSRVDVGVVTGADYEQAVRSAVALVGGIEQHVTPGDVVAIKPNMSFNSPPELKANTDPRIVGAVVRLCIEARAARVYVFDRTLTSPKLSYRTSGIEAAAREAGARVLYVNEINQKNYRQITIPEGVFLKESLINRHLLEADVFINLPVAKHHSSAGLTMGMKNLMGITGDRRNRWHWQLHEAISDINLAVKSHLTIIDATNIMLRNGPTGGSPAYLKRLDTVIASPNVVQADCEGAKLFGRAPKSLPYLKLAEAKGIGSLSGYAVERQIL